MKYINLYRKKGLLLFIISNKCIVQMNILIMLMYMNINDKYYDEYYND